MIFGAAKSLAQILCLSLITCAFAQAECRVNTVIVKGRVEQGPRNAKVRVQLFYVKGKLGDSAEATLESEAFTIPIDFLTQSHRPMMGLGEKCDRKPKTVVVTLMEGEREVDRISLDFAKEFVKTDPSAYGSRSELVLHGSR